MLPVRLVYGALFTNHTALNLWLLRQLISVLPMLLAAVLLVYLHTRFEKPWAAIGLLLLLLSMRAVVRSSLQWWHPDALSLLAVVLTLFFLARDQLRFGRDFFLAAAACGLAAGIKFAGFLLFPGDLRLSAGRAGAQGADPRGAPCCMPGCSSPSWPPRWSSPTHSSTTAARARNWSKSRPSRPKNWTWATAMTTRCITPRGQPGGAGRSIPGMPSLLLLGFLLISLISGCIWGPNQLLNRLILLWIVPYSIYLFYFVAVKPDHYWLPVMLPLYSAALNIPLAIHGKLIPGLAAGRAWEKCMILIIVLLLAGHLVTNFIRPYSGALAVYSQALQVESRFQP